MSQAGLDDKLSKCPLQARCTWVPAATSEQVLEVPQIEKAELLGPLQKSHERRVTELRE